MFTSNIYAQNKYGAIASYIINSSSYNVTQSTTPSSPFSDTDFFSINDSNNGFIIGIYYRNKLSNSWNIKLSVDYMRTKQKYKILPSTLYEKYEKEFDNHHLQFGLLPSYKFSSAFSVYAGPKVYYNLKNSEINSSLEKYDIDLDFNTISYAMSLGLVINYEIFVFDIGYTYTPNYEIAKINLLGETINAPIEYNSSQLNIGFGIEI